MDGYIEKLREDSPTLKELTFLNHASTGPLHGRTSKAMHEYLDFWKKFDFTEAKNKKEESRALFAKLTNAKKEEITFTSDVTQGTNIALNVMNYDKNSNIVCYWNDYVSQVYSALFLQKTKGVEYRTVQDRNGSILPEDFAEKIDKNTRIVLISHVQWLNGFKADVKEIAKIAHENGAKIVVDTIQSTGVMKNDVRDWDVDFLTCGVAKWLLGPNQTGFFFMKEELVDEYYPPFAGYQGTDYGNIEAPYWDVNKLEFLPTIDKFSISNTGNMMYHVAYAGMKIIDDYGIENVEKRILDLTDYLIEKFEEIPDKTFLTPLEKNFRSGIINVKLNNSIELAQKLSTRKIVVSSRYGGLRISPHFYNSQEDIDILIKEMKLLLD